MCVGGGGRRLPLTASLLYQVAGEALVRVLRDAATISTREMPPKPRGLGALAGTLHDAETRQVEDFIRQRSKALDSDISAMRRRLGMGGAGKTGVLGEGIPNVLSTVEGMGTSTSVSTSLRALRDEVPVFSGHDTSAAQTRFGAGSSGQYSPPRAASMKDRLGTFLARIKIRKLAHVPSLSV